MVLQLVKQSTSGIHFSIILPHTPKCSKWPFLWLPYLSCKSAPPILRKTCLTPVICLIWSRDSHSGSSTKLHINATFDNPILLPSSQPDISSSAPHSRIPSHWTGGVVGFRAGLYVLEKGNLSGCRDSNPGSSNQCTAPSR